MADNRFPSESLAMDMLLQSATSDLYVCLPGIIQSFDPSDCTVEVKPAIRKKYSVSGKITYNSYPSMKKVPVVIPYAQSSGYCMTVPIKKGDECILVFCDRALDNFQKFGGEQNPESCGGDNKTSEPRSHHLTDAICIPGIISKPNAIANWNQEAIEIRDKNGTNYFRIGNGRIDIVAGVVNIQAAENITIDAPNFKVSADGTSSISGEVTAKDLKTDSGFKANTHKHTGVQTGNSNTGVFTQ